MILRNFYLKSACVLILAILLIACSKRSTLTPIIYEERPVEQIYNRAHDALMRRKYIEATQQFNEVERQHPYSQWARRAMVMSAFTSYLQNKYDDAIITAQRFLSLYPGSPQASYAYYLVAQSYYERISNVARDQHFTALAQQGFIELIRRFPDSDYARDARLKIDLTQDHLAGKEMEIGRFYLKKQHYLAALKRFNNVIRNYQHTSHTAEALHRMVEIYVSLGIEADAQKFAAVLNNNYPASMWYRDTYNLLKRHDFLPKNAQNTHSLRVQFAKR